MNDGHGFCTTVQFRLCCCLSAPIKNRQRSLCLSRCLFLCFDVSVSLSRCLCLAVSVLLSLSLSYCLCLAVSEALSASLSVYPYFCPSLALPLFSVPFSVSLSLLPSLALSLCLCPPLCVSCSLALYVCVSTAASTHQ